MDEFLVADNVTKQFGGVQALRGVSLAVREGSIHALVGENGAGKSTFGKIVAGFYRPDSGALRIDGRDVRFRSPRDALLHSRITIVGQERVVIPQQTVIENVFLGREQLRGGVLNRRALTYQYEELCERTGFTLPPSRRVGSLRGPEQLQVEIMRALVRDARLIVMDEVTAALTAEECKRVFDVVRALRAEGRAVLYISHFLNEVLALCDLVTIFRDGSLVRTTAAAAETPSSLVAGMVGRELALTFPEKAHPSIDAPSVLSVEGLTRRGVIEDIGFDIRAGEILGLAGLIGSGRSEVARTIFGADRAEAGVIRLNGAPIVVRKPRDAINAGIALLPESRKEEGLLMRRSIVENTSIVHLDQLTRHGILDFGRENREVTEEISRLDVRTAGPRVLVEKLSGGNQQKVLFGKWLFRTPRVLIADEPTRGVDVGAKHSIYVLIAQLAAAGMAVLLISSELEEVLGLAHRVLVMRLGRIVAEFDQSNLNEDAVLRAAFAA